MKRWISPVNSFFVLVNSLRYHALTRISFLLFYYHSSAFQRNLNVERKVNVKPERVNGKRLTLIPVHMILYSVIIMCSRQSRVVFML